MKTTSVGLVCLLTPLLAFASEPGPLPLSVSNVTASSAELSWEPPESGSFDYIITAAGSAPNEMTTPAGTLTFGPHQYSELWGKEGELWDPEGRLPDITNVGYMEGKVAIPDWPVGVNVKDHGAVGDGVHDDTQAIQSAIDACPPEHAVFLPNGTYMITGLVHINKNYIVVRGEDRDRTILKFPKGLREAVGDPKINYTNWGGFINIPGDINAYSLRGDSTHRSIENLTFEFPELQSEGHFSTYGASAISLGSARDSWVRNILIKNADHGILMSGALWATVTNIEFDNFPGRVAAAGGDGGYVGHNGIKVTGRYNLIHDVTFRGKNDYEHSIGFNNLTQGNVISRIRGTDLQMDDHGGSVKNNYFTEINLGEGTPESGRPTYRGANKESVWWNVSGTVDQPYSDSGKRKSAADPSRTSVVVGLRTSEPGDTTTPEFWHETKTPELLHPQNIYLAQLEKLGKPALGEQLSPGGSTANPETILISGLSSNTTYEVYVRNRAPSDNSNVWTAVTSFTTGE